MKIAMPVKKKGNDFVLSSAYGKAPVFLIFDTDKGEYYTVKNETLSGKGVAQILKNENVNVVITNHIGQGAFNALMEVGIKAYFTEKKNHSWKEIIDEFLNGNTTEITSKNFYMVPQYEHHKH